MIGIYKIISPSGKIYIGQSFDIDRRWREHKKECHSGKLKNSFKKYGVENHIFEVIEECSIELLNERERHYQDFYDVLSPNGLNLTLQQTDTQKYIMSDEVKQKISKVHRGRVLSEEVKKNLSRVNTGKKHSEETKRKCSLTTLKYTDESRRKMKVARENRTQDMKDQVKESIRKSWENYTPEERQERINKSVEGRKLKNKLKDE